MAALKSFLERIAERQSSFVLFGDRVYDISHSNGYPDFLEAAGLKLALVPSMRFSDFEALDEKVMAGPIETYCREYIKEQIDTELKAEKDVAREKSRIHALNFIMNEFLPFFLSKKYMSEDFMMEELGVAVEDNSEPLERAKAEITAKLTADFGSGETESKENPAERMRQAVLKREKQQADEHRVHRFLSPWANLNEMGIDKEKIPSSVLGEITRYQPMYVMEGKVFLLMLAENFAESDLSVKINGKNYVADINLTELRKLSDFFMEQKKQAWRITALERSQDAFEEIRQMITREEVAERHMHELAKLKEYDLGECGFMLKDDNYYVFSRIPKFATQDGRNPEVFWPFDATRVAIHIGWQNGKSYTSDRPRVIERRQFHPCLSERDREGGFCEICNRDAGSYKNTLLDMVRKLSDAVNVIIGPLNRQSLESHSGHTYFGEPLDRILKQGSLTREQAAEKGYLVVEVMGKDEPKYKNED